MQGVLSPEMRLIRTIAWIGAALAAVAIIAFVVTRGLSSNYRVAPALPKQRLAGPRVTLASLRGKPALVLFWASWCGQCSQEAQAVRSFAQSPAGAGRIVGVDWADRPRAAKSFLRHHRWSFSNLRDVTGEVGLSYGLTKLPALFVIDAHGHILKALSGTQTQHGLERALRSA
ncbi:MAG TPA: TlpA disulfide reductase family protein [Solirubrobacteraceae bacterium]|nr:TlpA disulfide reductase family protein [Solirubrobacteraceae bacterium]